MSVLEAYWALPEEPGTAIELAEDEADDGLGDVRVLKVREIIKGELVEFEFSVFCVSQCITCNLPDRQRYLLETNLGRKSYPTILEMFPEDSPAWYARDGVTRLGKQEAARRLGRHVRLGHSELAATERRLVAEYHAAKAGVDLEGSAESIMTDMAAIQIIRDTALQGVIDGEVPLNASHALKAIELGLSHAQTANDSQIQVAVDAIQAFMRVLTKQLDPATMQWAIAALDAEPKVQALLRTAYESQVAGG